jgi:hypothetical protein
VPADITSDVAVVGFLAHDLDKLEEVDEYLHRRIKGSLFVPPSQGLPPTGRRLAP